MGPREVDAGGFLLRLKTRSEAFSKIIHVCLVLAPSILITFIIAGYWAERNFPWWTDGGIWLKHTNAILGNAYPMWEEGTYQYPPIFFILTAAVVKLTGDPLISIKLLALISFFIYPLTMYLLTKEMFRSIFAGIVAAWVTAFYPLFLEFLGWGGYPNILTFSLLSLAFYFTIKFVEKENLRNGVLAAIFAVTVTLTHHLTSLILLGVLALWMILSTGFKGVERKHVATLLIITISSFMIYRLMYAWPPDFVLFNEAAYYRLRLSSTLLRYDNDVFLAFFAAVFIVSIVSIIRMKIPGYKLRLVAAWILTPLIVTQVYLLKIALDYNRILFFVYQPLLLLAFASTLLVNPKELIGFFRGPSKSLKQIGHLVSLVIIVLLVASITLNGITTVKKINLYYDSIDPYGDNDKLWAVNWLAANSNPRDVVVAEEPIGRWIEGLSERRVLLHTPPCFLFMKGEVEREYAARSLLISQYGIKSMDAWILEQSPCGYMSPIIAFNHLGDYVNALFLSAKDSYISLMENNETKVITFANSTRTEVRLSRSSTEPSLIIKREASLVEINEKLSLNPQQTITLTFNVTRLQSIVKIENATLNFNFIVSVLGRPRSEKPLTLNIPTELGEIEFSSTNPYVFDYSTDLKQFKLTFKNQASFKLEIQAKEIDRLSNNIETYTWKEVADKYSVKYIVLPKMPMESYNLGATNNWRSTRLEFSHLLNSTALEVADESERVIILRYIRS